jgi:hypothetical protein
LQTVFAYHPGRQFASVTQWNRRCLPARHTIVVRVVASAADPFTIGTWAGSRLTTTLTVSPVSVYRIRDQNVPDGIIIGRTRYRSVNINNLARCAFSRAPHHDHAHGTYTKYAEHLPSLRASIFHATRIDRTMMLSSRHASDASSLGLMLLRTGVGATSVPGGTNYTCENPELPPPSTSAKPSPTPM